MDVNKYKIVETIDNTGIWSIKKAINKSSSKEVLIKEFKIGKLTNTEILEIKNYFEKIQNLGEYVSSEIIEYFIENDGVTVVYDDKKLISLKDYLKEIRNPSISTLELLKLAVSLADLLNKLTKYKLTHNYICSCSILYSKQTNSFTLIDFAHKLMIRNMMGDIQGNEWFTCLLPVISPEQTGRLNRGVDYRTDIYSFGIVLYELFSGSLPFSSNDPQELLHYQIAKSPSPINQPNIPPILSEIIIKCLAKSPDDRYQSFFGLQHDLNKCLELLHDNNIIKSFRIMTMDMPIFLKIPDKLYGREQEFDSLHNGLDEVRNGKKTVCFVSGYAGIGKSRLIIELQRNKAKNDYFVQGKFDQLDRNVPYSAIVEAYRSLIRGVLLEDTSTIAEWKIKFMEALKDSGQIIIDVIPELELIIGKQNAVINLDPTESQKRFTTFFQKFSSVFSSDDRILILFIDDLQWADLYSLNLIEIILNGIDSQSIYFIGAYRNNEIDNTHPLFNIIKELETNNKKVNSIKLVDLDHKDIQKMIAETLNKNYLEVEDLSKEIIAKTKGNPFFVIQFLKSLFGNDIIKYESDKGCWTYNVLKIKESDISENVIELIIKKLRKLPENILDILGKASCIGNSFDLQLISIITNQNIEDTRINLSQAIDEEFIIESDDVNIDTIKSFQPDNEMAVHTKSKFKFIHDKIQQAAYEMIPEKDKQGIHLQIGRLLHDNFHDTNNSDIFNIVNQYNFGIDLIIDEDELNLLSKLNYQAAINAKSSAAYNIAYKYIEFALKLFKTNLWIDEYPFSLALHILASEIAYLNSDYEKLSSLVNKTLTNAKNDYDKLSIYEIHMQSFMSQHKYVEAIDEAFIAFELLNFIIPRNPNKIQVLIQVITSKIVLNKKTINGFSELPEMTNEKWLKVSQIFRTVATPIYYSSPDLFIYLLCKLMRLFIKYGLTSDLTPYLCAGWGIVLTGVLRQIDEGVNISKIGTMLIDKLNARDLECKTIHVFHLCASIWKNHIRDSIKPLYYNFTVGIETGDFEYASLAALVAAHYQFLTGIPLSEVNECLEKYWKAINRLEQKSALHFLEVNWQELLNIHKVNENPCQLIGDVFNEELMLKEYQKANDSGGLAYMYVNKQTLCYLFHNYKEAINLITVIKKCLASIPSQINEAVSTFYSSLSMLAYIKTNKNISLQKKYRLITNVNKNQKKMRLWAVHAPMNFKHKYLLVEAEEARVLGKKEKAEKLYDESIKFALENDYRQEAAIANECAFSFYYDQGKTKLAKLYIEEAYRLYKWWEAFAKLNQLEEKYPDILKDVMEEADNKKGSTLDMEAVVEVFKDISSEINLDKLLEKIIKTVVEVSGAQKAFFILNVDEKLFIQAEYKSEEEKPSVIDMLSVTESDGLDVSIVQYVQRTKEDVVLDDASCAGNYTGTDYVQKNQTKSLLCIPVINQGKLLAILYLENNLTTNAFIPKITEMLKLISSQAAISLENAMLYENLEEKVRERTAELSDANEQIKKQESMLVQQEKMAILGDITASVAHEINTPLLAVSMGQNKAKKYTDRLRENIELTDELKNDRFFMLMHEKYDKGQALQVDGLSKIRQQVVNMKSFIKFQDESTEFDVNEEIGTVLSIMSFSLLSYMDVEKDFQVDLPKAAGNAAEINQAIMNLIKNASEAKKPDVVKGSIIIKTYMQNDKVCIELSDDGVGISEENKSRIFESRFTTKDNAVGMGLSAVKDMVDSYGGLIELESQLGQGATFRILLNKVVKEDSHE